MVWVTSDRVNFLRKLFLYLIGTVTGFAIYFPPNLIIVAERFEPIDITESMETPEPP